MLPLVPLTVLTFIPTGNPSPVTMLRLNPCPMVRMASTVFLSIISWAFRGSLQTSFSLKYPDSVHFSTSSADKSVRSLSTTTRLMLRTSIFAANGKTSIITIGKTITILGSIGSLKNCLNSFSIKYFHMANLFLPLNHSLILNFLTLTASRKAVMPASMLNSLTI